MTQPLLQEVKELGRIKNSWFALGATLAKAAAELDDKPGSSGYRQWLVEVAEAAGYSASVVGRIILAHDFADRIKKTGGGATERIENLGFSSIEIVRRLDALNPQLALSCLADLEAHRLTQKELVEVYRRETERRPEETTKISLAKRETHSFSRAVAAGVENWVRQNRIQFRVDTFAPRGALRKAPGKPDAIAYDPMNREHSAIGFESVRLEPGVANESIRWEQLLYRTFFVSRFYRTYWLVFHENVSMDYLSKFERELHRLQIHSVGILKVASRDGPQIVTFSEITKGLPFSVQADWSKHADWCSVLK